MKKHLSLFLGVLIFNLFAGFGTAHADPVTAAITTILTTVGVSASIASAIASFTVALLKNVGLSLLGQALSKKPKIQNAGIKTQTSTGGSVSQTFVLGRRATAGQLVTPLMSYGTAGKTENAYLVYVIALGCIPGQTIAQVILNDEYVPLATTETPIGGTAVDGTPNYGLALGGVKYADHAWLRYHPGDQTAVDPFLYDMLKTYPERPWDHTMIGKGMCYAVLVFKYNREILNAPPSVRFVMEGVKLYDPRKDGSIAGSSGGHTWGNPSTYEPTLNPAVMMYNLHRGITLPDGSVYGGEAKAEDLPVGNWIAAMNACDEPVSLSSGGSEKRFTAGLEVSLSDEPADVMEALETACQAQQVEIGGVWKIRVGGPGAPVAFISDDDILIDHDRNHDMFPGLNETHNGIQASHPLPSALWEMTDAPVRYNSDLEKEDDGRRLIADLTLPAVFSPTQAQRLMKSYIEEERRFRRHYLTLGPYASMLEPLDCIAWTSASEGYAAKEFEVTTVNEGLRTLNVELGLRERNSSDFTWTAGQTLPWPAGKPGVKPQVVQYVPSFSLKAESVKDTANANRRPAIRISWDGTDMPDVRGLMWEVRVKVQDHPTIKYELVTSGNTQDIASGAVLVSDGILGNTPYDVRARVIVDRPTDWTDWVGITTLDIRIDFDDLAGSLIAAIETPLDEILKTNLQLQTYQQVQDALNYTGDGRSLQFATLQAINKGQDAIDRVDLIGALTGDATAFVLNADFVKVPVPAEVGEGTVDLPMAGFISTTHAEIKEARSDITVQGQVIGGLQSRYSLNVETVGDTGNKAVAGMVFEADQETSTIGFFANNFFLADKNYDPAHYNDPAHPNSPIKYPFVYTSGQLYLNTNVNIAGNLVVDGTITTNKLIVNAVSSFNDDTFGRRTRADLDPLCATVPFNPEGFRVRISFRVGIEGAGERCAILIKIFKTKGEVTERLAIMGYIADEAFITNCTSYIYDFDEDEEEVIYTMKVMTVKGTNIGDGHEPGAIPVDTAIEGGNMTVESMKR